MNIKNWFHEKNIFKKPNRWIHNVVFWGVIIEIITLGLIITSMITKTIEGTWGAAGIWFYSLTFFTQQSNILVAIFVITFFFKKDAKIFKNSYFLVFVTAYITITFIGFNFFLLPGGVAYALINFTDDPVIHITYNTVISIFTNIFAHEINPVFMVSLYILLVKKTEVRVLKTGKQAWKYVGFGLIYPIIYLTYAAVIPFLVDFSVYGPFTNLNPNLYWSNEGASNDPNAFTNAMPGKPWYAMFFIIFIGFFTISLFVYSHVLHSYYSPKRIQRAKEKEQYRDSLLDRRVGACEEIRGGNGSCQI